MLDSDLLALRHCSLWVVVGLVRLPGGDVADGFHCRISRRNICDAVLHGLLVTKAENTRILPAGMWFIHGPTPGSCLTFISGLHIPTE